MKGDDVTYIHATDDFGTPILIEAEQQGETPEEFVAYWHKTDIQDFSDLGISFDIFYKTSSKENITLTQYFFRQLYENGYIFQRVIQQHYCETCQKFLPDRYVKGTCPYCSTPDQYSDGCEQCGKALQPDEIENPYCAVCGSKPVKKRSEHYFFDLPQFSGTIKKWLVENRNLKPDVKNYVLNWIKDGLIEWDITRDLPWGVPIPLEEAKGKVLYNWFDNHLCYISTALKYFADKGIDGKTAWNTSEIYHFIGKDIVYHHYLFLPAMRLAEGEYKLPDYIPTRGLLLLEHQKFSKSRGYYISLREFLNQYPADYLRYYLTAITPYNQADVNFSWDDFQTRINNELIAKIGNFIHRTLTFTTANYEGKIPEPTKHDPMDHDFVNKIKNIANEVGAEIEKNELRRGLERITQFATLCNQYFQRKQPWADKEQGKTCLYLCANAVKTLAIMLAPFLPFSTKSLWEQLNLKGSVHEQSWSSALELTISSGHEIQAPKILFQKVAEEEIEKQTEKLQKSHARQEVET